MDPPARHRDAAAIHELAAENHERAATFWAGQGDRDRAQLQSEMAAYERHGAELERRWADLDEPDLDDAATGAAETVAERTRHGVRHLTATLRQVASTLDRSAQLADDHATRREAAGRDDEAADERRLAEFARDSAQRARSQAEQWLNMME